MFDFLRKKKSVKTADASSFHSNEFLMTPGLHTPVIKGASRKRISDQLLSAGPTTRFVFVGIFCIFYRTPAVGLVGYMQ